MAFLCIKRKEARLLSKMKMFVISSAGKNVAVNGCQGRKVDGPREVKYCFRRREKGAGEKKRSIKQEV